MGIVMEFELAVEYGLLQRVNVVEFELEVKCSLLQREIVAEFELAVHRSNPPHRENHPLAKSLVSRLFLLRLPSLPPPLRLPSLPPPLHHCPRFCSSSYLQTSIDP